MIEKMKKLLIITNIFLVSMFLMPSCDVLEVEPVSQILSANFYKNAGDAEAALINAYHTFQGPLTQNYMAAIEGMGDGMRVASGGNFTRHERFEAQVTQGNVRDMWSSGYNTVQATNDVLQNVPNISDPALDKDRVLGEAHYLRGMIFFHLTRLYGKIPIITEPSKSPDQDFLVKRDELNVVYDQIISDLRQAETLLPTESSNRARASKGAARALLARVYMFRNNPGDFALALAETEKVMSDLQYALVAGVDYEKLWVVGEQNTSETIFEVSYRPNTSIESHGLEREFIPHPTNNPRIVMEQKVIDLFDLNPDDLRRDRTLAFARNTNYCRKYELNDVTVRERLTQVNNIILLRLADVILMRAECLNELDRTAEAIPFLNQIRTRAGIPATDAVSQAEVRLAIENERLLELVGEGVRYFDLVRTGRAMDLLPTLTNPDRLLWPIPGEEIDLNANLLPQNSSY